jgi:hypothetical protein
VGGKRAIASLLLVTGAVLGIIATSATAGRMQIHDACGGVDHPPFDRQYDGQGASFLLSAFAFDPSITDATAMVTGEGLNESVPLDIGPDGLADMALGIFSFGTYTVTVPLPEGDFTQNVSVGADDEPCDSSMLTAAPQATETTPPTEPTPTATSAPTETAAPTPTPTATPAATDAGGGALLWPGLIVGGLLLALIGWFLMRAKEDCPEEVAALQAARDACEAARAEAKEAREKADAEQAQADEVRSQLDDIRESFPDAGKPGGDSWVESEGTRITSMDVRMKRAAMKAAWEHYASNPNAQTAEETMDMWEQFDTAEFRERLRELDAQASKLAGELAKQQAEADAAKSAADAAEAKADAACKKAREAEQALEDCLKKKHAPPQPTPQPGGTTGGTTGGGGRPGVATGGGGGGSTPPEEEQGCPDGAEELRGITSRRFMLPIGQAFLIEGCYAHEDAERARGTAAELKDIGTALGWLSTGMTAVSGATTMWRAADGWEVAKEVVWSGGNIAANQASGRISESSRGISVPLPTSPLQAGIDTLSLMASITGHLLEAFAGLHERRLNDCFVREGTKMEAYTLRCANLWVCEGGQWVDKGKVFTVTREGTTTAYGKRHDAVTYPQVQAIMARWASRTSAQLRRKLQEMEAFRTGCTGS